MRFFSRSRRALAADGFWPWAVPLIVASVLVAAWITWFFLGEVRLYAASREARLETQRSAHRVDVPIDGQIVAVHVSLGEQVELGDLLLDLDAEDSRRQLAEEEATLEALGSEIDLLRRGLAASEEALGQYRRESRAAVSELEKRIEAAAESLELSRQDADRLERLRPEGLVTEADSSRAASEVRQHAAGLDSLTYSLQRLRLEQLREESERRAAIERSRSELRGAEGSLEAARARIERVRHLVGRFQVRAPVAGRLAELAELGPGAVIEEGTHVATVVPRGGFRVVALFDPEQALGRVRPSQRARLILEGFPRAEYGGLELEVLQVASEVRNGLVRVELALRSDPGSPIPLQHGLPGVVEVEVDRISPATLLMRHAGTALHGT